MKKLPIYTAAAFTAFSVFMSGCGAKAMSGGTDVKQAYESAAEAYMATAETGGAADKVPDPNAEELVIVSVYAPDEDGGLDKDMDAVPVLDAQSIWAKLIEYKTVKDGSEVISFEIDGENAVLNVNELDLSDEKVKVCVVNTFLENFELAGLDIEIDGRSTGETYKYNKDYRDIE